MNAPDLDSGEYVTRSGLYFLRDRIRSGASPERAIFDYYTVLNGVLTADLDEPPPPWAEDAELEPMNTDARRGVVGRFVELIEPHTESDPAALLVQLLVGIGSLLGRGAHARVEDDRHYPNLFALLVGATARGRKGTSWRRVQQFLGAADPTWATSCIQHGGMASGEGLVWSVRDAHGDVPGVDDKRRLIAEGEFGGVLKVLAREGNTLSPILRNAWDTGCLANMNKLNPCQATAAHVSVIAHVTRDEFLRRLDSTEVAGGLVNRFLLVGVRRSKLLPHGGSPSEADLLDLAHDVRAALAFGREPRELAFDGAARALWGHAYTFLSGERPGVYGAATARAEAQTLRLALLYAVLDRSDSIGVQHLRSALAVWDYCERSAFQVFGMQQGDPIADDVLAHLRRADAWVSRTDLVNALSRHTSGARLQRLLDKLIADNLVRSRQVQTGGRPREEFHARKARKASVLDLCSLSSLISDPSQDQPTPIEPVARAEGP